MSSLTPLWKFLEDRPRATAVIEEWQALLGPAFCAVEPILSPTGQVAKSYPNTRPNGLPLRVVRHADGSVVAVCPEGSGKKRLLSESELALFSIDPKRLRKSIAAALDLHTSHATVEPASPLLHVAAWEPKPAASFKLIVCNSTSPSHLREHLLPTISISDHPMLVATPTRRHWPDGFERECGRHKAMLFSLDRVLDLDGDQFVATEVWNTTLAALAKTADLRLPENFANRQPKRKRAERAAKIESLKKALIVHIRSARDHAYSAKQRGDVPSLLPRPAKKELAAQAGVRDYDISRCFEDDMQLERLYEMANNLDDVMEYGR